MQWDSRNQLQHVTQVQRDHPDGQDDDTETYLYDGGGQRVRKVRRAKTRGGEHISEVRYLPGLEIRSRTTGEHLHVVLAQAGRNTVRLLNRENGEHQFRYSVYDHLGSSTLELDQSGELLSQESYYPYGGQRPGMGLKGRRRRCTVVTKPQTDNARQKMYQKRL